MITDKLLFGGKNNSYPETMFFVPLQDESNYLYSYDGTTWNTGEFPDIFYEDTSIAFMESTNTWVVCLNSGAATMIEVYTSKDLITWKYTNVLENSGAGYNYGKYYLYYDKSTGYITLAGFGANNYSSKDGKNWNYSVSNYIFTSKPSYTKICSNGNLLYTSSSDGNGIIDGYVLGYNTSINDCKYYAFDFAENIVTANVIEDKLFLIYDTQTCTDEFGTWNDYNLIIAPINNINNYTTIKRINLRDDENAFEQVFGNGEVVSVDYLYGKVIITIITPVNVLSHKKIYDLSSGTITLQQIYGNVTGAVHLPYPSNRNTVLVKDGIHYFVGKIYGENLQITSILNENNNYTAYDTGLSSSYALGIWSN